MDWLNTIIDEIISRHPEGRIVIQSGASPSGTYHMGHLREIVTSDAILLELRKRGREALHIHFVDDLDGLRKIPVNLPSSYESYLGKPLCDIPAPGGSDKSLSDFFVSDFIASAEVLGIEMEVIKSHEKYRSGFFVTAIERVLNNVKVVKKTLEDVSSRKLDEQWSPIQVMEEGYLKNRRFLKIDESRKVIYYQDSDGQKQSVKYDDGSVKLDWRSDWPARWWLIGVDVEAFGRDHATKGGSFDTGAAIMRSVFEGEPPLAVPYDFINRVGDTKKMSASKGTGIDASEVVRVLPAEVLRFFILSYAPVKRLYFDEVNSTIKLVDEFAALSAKTDPTDQEKQLLYLCTRGLDHRTVSSIPFSLLVASYQTALKDTDKTLEVLSRTEYANVVEKETEILRTELSFINEWLKSWAPEEVKFELLPSVNPKDFDETQKKYLGDLAEKIKTAPPDADGEWFHKAVYEFKEAQQLSNQILFSTLYQVLIGKNAGPRAGWFLSILPRDWLIKRLNFEA